MPLPRLLLAWSWMVPAALAAVTATCTRTTPVSDVPVTNDFAGLATEKEVCTSHSVVVELLDPVPTIVIITEAAPGPVTRNFSPCPVDPLTACSTISACQLSPAATAKARPGTSLKVATLLVQSAAHDRRPGLRLAHRSAP